MRERWIIQIDDALRSIAMLILYVFFFAYSIGNVVGIGEYYLVFLYTAICFAVILYIRNPSCLQPYRYYYVWILGFIFFQGFSLLYTINTNGVSMFFSLFKILLKVTAVTIICGSFKGMEKLLKGFSYVGGLVFFTLYITGNLFGKWRLGEDTVGNANSFAMNILVFSIGSGYCFFKSQGLIKRIIYGSLFCMDLAMIFLSGGRKYLLFLMVYIFMLYIYNSKRVNILRTIKGIVFIGVLIGISYYLIMNVEYFYQAIGVRLVGLGTTTGALGTNDQKDLMSRAIEAFVHRPILGWGIGGFQQYHFINYGKIFYSHSNVTELLANFGIVGFCFYYSNHLTALLALINYQAKYSFNERYEAKSFFMPLLCGILVLDVFSVTFNQTAYVPMFVMWISGYVYEVKHDTTNIFI